MRIVMLIIRAPVWPFIWLFRLLTGDADWASVHARILPFGSAIGTYLVANLTGKGEWAFWRNWDALMDAAGLGVIFHGMAAVVILEGGIKMGLYVVDKWKADRARERAALREEVLNDVAELLRQNPEADPMAVLEQLRRESRNGKSSAE